MSYNGTGTFDVFTPGNPVVTGTPIDSSVHNNTMSDFAVGLTNAMTRDGQSPATSNIPLGGFKLTGLGAATTAGDAVRFEQLPGASNLLPIASGGTGSSTAAAARSSLGFDVSEITQEYTAFTSTGTAPNFVLTPSPAITSYSANQRFRVKFNATGAGADFINISGVGNKSLKQYDSIGAKIAAVISSGQLTDVEYDGVDFIVLNPLTPVISVKQIQSLTATVAASALTCTLNPTYLDFRATPLTSGAVNTRNVAAAISVVVPSTATLGTISAQQSRLILLAIDNAGTVELAVVNIAGGNNLDETTLINTTAISGASNASNVIYSTTARTGVPFRVVGFIDSTQATAGTWATAPSTIQGIGGQALAALASAGFGQMPVAVTRTSGVTYYAPVTRSIGFSWTGNSGSGATLTIVTPAGSVLIGQCLDNTGQVVPFISYQIPAGCAYVLTITTGTVRYCTETR